MKRVITIEKVKKYGLSILTGIINALFGAGGGIVAVKLFSSREENQKQAQASAVCMLLPLSIISAGFYLWQGHTDFSMALPYLPFGAIGAFAGTRIMKRIPAGVLKKLFSLFMIYTGIRMIMR